jgi:hypothetical protein
MRFDDFMYGGDMYGGDTFGADEYSGGYGGAGLPSFAVAPPPAYEAPPFTVDPYTAPPAYSQEDIQRAAQAFVEQQQKANALSTQSSDALNSYIAQQAAKGVEVASTDTSQGGGPMGSSGVFGLPDFGARFDPMNPAASTGQVFRFATGQVGAPNALGEMEYRNAAPVVFQPGQKYIMTDGRGEKVLGSATTPEEMAGLVELSGKLPYGFQLFPANEQGSFTPGQELFGKDDPRPTGLAGAIANYGIPIAMGLLAGPLGPLAAAAAAAGTTGVTKLTSGYTPKDALIAAAISGATAGTLKGFTGPTNPLGLEPFGTAAKNAAAEAAAQGVGGAIAQGAGGALGQAIPSLGEMVVTGFREAAPSLLSQVAPSVVQAGLSGLGQSLLPSQPATTQGPLAEQAPPSLAALPGDSPLITVPGSVTSSNAFPSLAAGLNGIAPVALAEAAKLIAAEQQAAEQQRADEERMITVTSATRPPSSAVVPSLAVPALAAVPSFAAAIAQPTPATTKPVVEEDPLTVTGVRDTTTVVPTNLVPSAITAATAPLLSNALTTPDPATTTSPDKKLSVSDYLRLAGLASSGIGLLGGGGGPEGTAAGNVPGGLGRLNPIFSAKLPTGADVNIPGGVGTASNLAARPMGDEDWLTYGQRPEKSFFNYVPQPPTGMAHGGSLAAKRGGRPSRSSFAVNGPGTGRSDDIPAVLSDGEYVIDAETVALLGDGSSKAGAKKLDDLRVKIRKHKGQRLSQGRFSSDAKKPEAYLTGGRI